MIQCSEDCPQRYASARMRLARGRTARRRLSRRVTCRGVLGRRAQVGGREGGAGLWFCRVVAVGGQMGGNVGGFGRWFAYCVEGLVWEVHALGGRMTRGLSIDAEVAYVCVCICATLRPLFVPVEHVTASPFERADAMRATRGSRTDKHWIVRSSRILAGCIHGDRFSP